jgi:hypothetical protein
MIFCEKFRHFGIKIAYLIILGEIKEFKELSDTVEQNYDIVFMIYPKGLKTKIPI